MEQKEIGHLGIQLNETVEFTDATPKRELHIPTQYHTLEDAHSAAKDGDLLVLQPGTFHATGKRLVITKDVELEGAGEDSSEVIVHNSELVVSGCKAKIHNLQFSQSRDNAVTVVSGGHAVLEDCEFVAPEGSGVEVKGKGSCIVVRHCVFHSGLGHGVLAHEGADALVVNSEFEGMARSALKVLFHPTC